MIEKILEYVNYFLNETKQNHLETNDVILKSALVYQYLYHKHFDEPLTTDRVLEMNDGEIGLLGPGNGCLTRTLERMFGWSRRLHTHSILHDAFGRFYNDFGRDRGYLYMIPARFTPKYLKGNPLCGQIFGIIFCLSKGIII